MGGPLEGLRVIEFAGLGPGPFCGMMLADHGAEVIRIDRIGAKGLVQDPAREFLHRSRKNIAIDIKTEDGLALARQMCRSADAVFEGYRPGVMERLGLGPEVLLGDNPRLVYGRMTGFGQDGPYAAMAGHDINYIALSGALHISGRAGEKPTPPANLVGDFGGGGMMLAFGLLAAIFHARATGQGQVVDCAMTEGSALLAAMIYSLHSDNLWSDERGGNILDTGAHYYDSYETADDKYVSIGPVEPHFYKLLIDKIGLGDDPDLAIQNDRSRWQEQKRKIGAAFAAKTRDEWCAILEGTDACFSPVMSLAEAPHHKHNAARRAFVDVDGRLQPGPAPRYSRTRTNAPRTMAGGPDIVRPLLSGLGLDEAEINRLHKRNIVA